MEMERLIKVIENSITASLNVYNRLHEVEIKMDAGRNSAKTEVINELHNVRERTQWVAEELKAVNAYLSSRPCLKDVPANIKVQTDFLNILNRIDKNVEKGNNSDTYIKLAIGTMAFVAVVVSVLNKIL